MNGDDREGARIEITDREAGELIRARAIRWIHVPSSLDAFLTLSYRDEVTRGFVVDKRV